MNDSPRLRAARQRVELSKQSPRYHAAPTIHNLRLLRDWAFVLSVTAWLGFWAITGMNWLSLHGVFWLNLWLWPVVPVTLAMPAYLSMLAVVLFGLFLVFQVMVWFMHLPGWGWVDDDIPMPTEDTYTPWPPRRNVYPDGYTHTDDRGWA